jgi:hypothetical protein
MAERKGLLEWAIKGLKHELSALEAELAGAARSVAKVASAGAESVLPGKPRRKRRRMSAAGRARIAAAQKARWAKRKADQAAPNKARRKTRKRRSPARSTAA